ncbi:hypothetical protein BKA70DRAFT_1242335 [Coprinopsis sp. MPI-PUGE-AT-0042]|nr:hypothetical protein BKA70DRAFT_1242335 [Coprinopsis sp. MPI-PUGE-AT-0042]
MALTNSCSHAALEFMHSPPASRSTRVGISQPPSPDTPDAPLGTFGAHMIEWWETEADPLQQEMTWYMDHQCSEVSDNVTDIECYRRQTVLLGQDLAEQTTRAEDAAYRLGRLVLESMKPHQRDLQQASSQGLTLEYPQMNMNCDNDGPGLEIFVVPTSMARLAGSTAAKQSDLGGNSARSFYHGTCVCKDLDSRQE